MLSTNATPDLGFADPTDSRLEAELPGVEVASQGGQMAGALSAGPRIQSLEADPPVVTSSGVLQLTAKGVDSSAARVAFYRDLGGEGQWSLGNDSFDHAVEIGAITSPQQWDGLTIHDAEDEDHFRFEILPAEDTYRFEFQFDQPAGDFQVDLYDAVGEYVETAYSLTDRSQLDLRGLPPGTYHLVVSSLGNVGAYDMAIVSTSSIAPDRFEPNTDFASAHDLGTLTHPRTWNGLTLHERFEADYFRFEIQPDQDAFDFQMRVNNPPPGFLFLSASIFPEGASRSREAWSWTTGEVRISLQGLEPGVHYLVLSSMSPIASYSLSLRAAEPLEPDRLEPNDTFATAHSLGSISGPKSLPDLTIHDAYDEDVFRFEILPQQDAYAIQVRFDYERADFDITLFDEEEVPIRVSRSWAGGQAQLGLQGLEPGVYYASVFPTDEWIDHYDFAIVAAEPVSPDPFEPNDSLPDAHSLGTLSGPSSWTALTLHDHHDLDLFHFEVPPGDAAYEFEVLFHEERANFDLSIVDQTDQWVRLAGSWGTGRARIGLQNLEPGDYYLEVVSWDGQVGPYDLVVRDAAPVPPDRFEADQRLGVDQNGADGWSWSGTTADWPAGDHTVFAVAQDSDGVWGTPVSATVTIATWQNPHNRYDVNNDGIVSPLDVLLILNKINESGSGPLPPRTAENEHLGYLDVNGDGNLTPLDALLVINRINYGGPAGMGAGEGGEGEGIGPLPAAKTPTFAAAGTPPDFFDPNPGPELRSPLVVAPTRLHDLSPGSLPQRSPWASSRRLQFVSPELSETPRRDRLEVGEPFDLLDAMEECLHGLS